MKYLLLLATPGILLSPIMGTGGYNYPGVFVYVGMLGLVWWVGVKEWRLGNRTGGAIMLLVAAAGTLFLLGAPLFAFI